MQGELSESGIKINALTQDERDRAMHHARLRIAGEMQSAGEEPQIEHFLKHQTMRYPKWITYLIYALATVMLAGAFLPSAIRLHQVGLSTFGESVSDATSKYIAALCIVLMSETGQVIFSLAYAITQGKWLRIGLLVGAFICTGIALSGNAAVSGAHAIESLFAFLETFAPPLLVLITSQVLKTLMLHSVEDRFIAKQSYATEHLQWQRRKAQIESDWQIAYDHANEHPDWQRFYANALREALRNVNRRSTAVLRDVTDDDWRLLVHREMRAEQWYVMAERKAQEDARIQDAITASAQSEKRTGQAHGDYTGEVRGAMAERDGMHIATCPYCAETYAKPTPRAAKNALSGHLRGCVKRKENASLDDTQEAQPAEV